MLEAEDLDARIVMLQNLAISRGLDDTQLLRLAKSATMVQLDEGQSAFYTEGRDDRFFIVVEGKIRAAFARGRKQSYTNIILPGEFFGAEKVLYGQTSLESAVAVESCVLIWISSVDLHDLVREMPRLRQNLKSGSELYRLRHSKHFAWLTENEKVELFTRKHRIVLLISLLPPLGAGWLGMLFLWLASLIQVPAFSTLVSWAGFGVIGLALLWALWRIWLWSIDFYIITDQRVVWQQRLIGLYDSRTEIPYALVMPPRLIQSRYEHILGFGDVFLVSDRTPIDYRVYVHIDLLDIPMPEQIQALIEEHRKRASLVARAEEDVTIESVLAQYLEPAVTEPAARIPPAEYPPGGNGKSLGGDNAAGSPPASEAAAQAPPAPTPGRKKPPVHKRIADSFKTRLEDGTLITYRKHWLVLFRKVWMPTLVSLALLGLLAFLLERRVTHHISSPSVLTLVCTGLVIYIFPVLWWIYQVLDWRNDVYQLADDKLLDIERKPFGGELISRPYLLSKLRSLDFERSGFLGMVFNSGSLFIGTVDSQLEFTGVQEPDRVLREVFYRVYGLRRKAYEMELRDREDAVARMVVAYHRRTIGGRRLGDTSEAQNSG